MRLWIAIVVLAALLGGGYWFLSGEPAEPAAGTGPDAAPVVGETSRAALDLERGAPARSTRATVVGVEPGEASPAGSTKAAPTAVEPALVPLVPEPVMEGGVTVDVVGGSAANELDQALELKYLNASRSERLLAMETLRTTLDIQRSSADKAVQESLSSLKHELGWLQSSLDG